MPDSYSPQYVEAAWYPWWERQGFFKPEYAVSGYCCPGGEGLEVEKGRTEDPLPGKGHLRMPWALAFAPPSLPPAS